MKTKTETSEREQCIESLAARLFEHRYPGQTWPEFAEAHGKKDLFLRRAEQWLRVWNLLDALEETVQ